MFEKRAEGSEDADLPSWSLHIPLDDNSSCAARGTSSSVPLYPWFSVPGVQSTEEGKYLKKIPESSKTQNLNLLSTRNH